MPALEERMAKIEGAFEQITARLDKVEQDIVDLRKDIRQLLYVMVGTWMTTILALILMWINLSGQIANLRPH
jgi:hypothetical protein